MDALSYIKQPILAEMERYKEVFDSLLVHDNPLLSRVLQSIAGHRGKMMRPILTLLAAKLAGGGEINDRVIYSAATFEFFHTASLVHDDIVDESDERRGQESVNNAYGNKVAVLVGDFILANSLLCASKTGQTQLIGIISRAAQDLADGELLQLNNVSNEDITEDVYFQIIRRKTAALFAACAEAGALAVSSDENTCQLFREFGENIGICFQIRDDIFDYDANAQIGKPTGNDMQEGKLTLPVIHALLSTGNAEMLALAHKVKNHQVSSDEIVSLVDFTKENGGIEYAVKVMDEYAQKAKDLLASFPDSDTKQALMAYADYVIGRTL
jgi:octaprenyl-diphosphate synthase